VCREQIHKRRECGRKRGNEQSGGWVGEDRPWYRRRPPGNSQGGTRGGTGWKHRWQEPGAGAKRGTTEKRKRGRTGPQKDLPHTTPTYRAGSQPQTSPKKGQKTPGPERVRKAGHIGMELKKYQGVNQGGSFAN